MNQQRGIIFDLDDTLCDWQAAQRGGEQAINHLLQQRQLDQQLFWQHFHAVNETLHSQFSAGHISKMQYRQQRFGIPLQQQQIIDEALNQQLNEVFIAAALDAIQFIQGAQASLQQALQLGYKVGILTNGASESQRNKLHKLGIQQQVHVVCISEETGIGKPHAAAFNNICQQLGCTTGNCLMVGDSWHNDIAPARSLGLAAYWAQRDNDGIQQQDATFSGSMQALQQQLQAQHHWWHSG